MASLHWNLGRDLQHRATHHYTKHLGTTGRWETQARRLFIAGSLPAVSTQPVKMFVEQFLHRLPRRPAPEASRVVMSSGRSVTAEPPPHVGHWDRFSRCLVVVPIKARWRHQLGFRSDLKFFPSSSPASSRGQQRSIHGVRWRDHQRMSFLRCTRRYPN